MSMKTNSGPAGDAVWIKSKSSDVVLLNLNPPSRQRNPPSSDVDYITNLIIKQFVSSLPDNLSPAERENAIQTHLDKPTTRHRFVFSRWPRPDPHPDASKPDFYKRPKSERPYESILPENSCFGKSTTNDIQHWGNSLYDFFYVQRWPEVPGYMSITTSSKMLKWCEENGEAEGKTWNGKEVPAKQMVEYAREERDPELVEAYDIAKLVKEWEEKVRKDHENKESEELWMHEWPPASVFDIKAYPPAWKSLEPFSTSGHAAFDDIPALEHYIPQHLLPKKLIVHDPYNLLLAVKQKPSEGWSKTIAQNPNCTHTYRLKSSIQLAARRKNDELEMEKNVARQKEVLDNFLKNPHSSTEDKPPGLVLYSDKYVYGKMPPPVYIVLPPQPPLQPASEAHLYISPSKYIGSGHHSFLYHAEWEVPRSLLARDELCWICVIEDACRILRKEDGENDERKEEKWNEISGERVLHNCDECLGRNKYCQGHEGDPRPISVYSGPYRVIQSQYRYQNLSSAPYCDHLQNSPTAVHPLTTRVRVAAKLSIQHDTHLQNEAVNYQAFPRHFFEHWSGYNVIRPLHDPTPVGAVVPMYYGYYVPEESEERKEKEKQGGKVEEREAVVTDEPGKKKPYLSPIMLMEHCGTQIVSEELSIDDKHECVSLCRRFNHAEWVHNSLFQRNILRKPGPLSAHPSKREENKKKRGGYGEGWSYRLIDFGRTEYVGDTPGMGIIGSLDNENQTVRSWFDGFRELGA